MRGTSNVPGHPVSELLQTANRATQEALLLHVCCGSNGCGHHRRNDHAAQAPEAHRYRPGLTQGSAG
jgi:hypothetical protein